jgi:hypothetical protein
MMVGQWLNYTEKKEKLQGKNNLMLLPPALTSRFASPENQGFLRRVMVALQMGLFIMSWDKKTGCPIFGQPVYVLGGIA